MDEGNAAHPRLRDNGQASRFACRWALASALATLALTLPMAARSACSIRTVQLPVTMVGPRAIATVRINGTAVPMMVDSGAFYSMLTDAAAAQLNLRLSPMPRNLSVQGLDGRVSTHMTSVDKLELLGGSIPDIDFIVGGSELGSNAMGLIGRNILSIADAEYDLAHGVIRLVFPNDDCAGANMAYWAGSTPVSEVELLRDNDNPHHLPAIRGLVKVNGKQLMALFDSGAYSTVVTLRAAHEAGVADKDMRLSGISYGLAGKPAKSWIAPFGTIDVGGEVISNNRLRVSDFDIHEDMLLGVDFFLSHRIYVSKKRRLMFFTYNGGRVFMDNTTALATAAASAASSSETADTQALDADGYARRGAASSARGDYADALADLDRACALEPANAGFFATRASVRLALRDSDKALADLDTALRLDPGLATARMDRAQIRRARKERDAALADLSMLDKALPPQSGIRLEMARMYQSLDAPAEALAQWNQWIPVHRHDVALPSALGSRCWARAELGIDLDRALDDCDEAVDADPKDASRLGSRAWVYLRLDKPSKAKADFDRSIAVHANGAWALYGRGIAHLRLGEAGQAEADLAAARKIQADVDARIKRAGLPVAP